MTDFDDDLFEDIIEESIKDKIEAYGVRSGLFFVIGLFFILGL